MGVARESRMWGRRSRRSLAAGVSALAIVGAGLGASVGGGVASAVGGSPENFLASTGVTIAWDEDFVGAIDPPSSYPTWPNMIYNNGDYEPVDGVVLGQTFAAEDINANIDDTTTCNDSWLWVQILCDLPATDDSLHYVTKLDGDAGFTINNDGDPDTEGYVVVDLGQSRTFNTLRVFQMFSDGKVTEAALYTHPATGTTRPAFNDPSWQLAAASPIGSGLSLNSDLLISCPTVIPLGTQTSRYVQMRFKNSGEFGDVEWIEVGGVKLFNETGSEPPSPETCPPEPPRNPIAVAGNETAAVSWTPGVGPAADAWGLQQSDDSGATWTTATTSPAIVPSAATSATVTGLTNGTEYVFRVRALSSVTDSPFTPPSNAVVPDVAPPTPDPAVPPTAPINVEAEPGDASASVSWDPPVSPGDFPVTSYQAELSPGGVVCLVPASETSCEVSGLVNGQAYSVRVRALSGAGWGSWSGSVSVTPARVITVPGPVRDVEAVRVTAAGALVLRWRSPLDNGGSPVTKYRVAIRMVGTEGYARVRPDSSSTGMRITGLEPGRAYWVRVRAGNAVGFGPGVRSDSRIRIPAR